MAATLLRMPVSATHSIVGATVGFALVAMGTRGINWGKLAMISEYKEKLDTFTLSELQNDLAILIFYGPFVSEGDQHLGNFTLEFAFNRCE